MFVCQWLVARARSISPRKMYARMPATARGPRVRRNQRCTDAVARLGTNANCNASCCGQAETHTRRAVHSADLICMRRSTGKRPDTHEQKIFRCQRPPAHACLRIPLRSASAGFPFGGTKSLVPTAMRTEAGECRSWPHKLSVVFGAEALR